MEEIIKQRAKKHLFYVCVAAIPLWLAWIFFDYLFAYELVLVFLPIRILGSLISGFIILSLKKNWFQVSTVQILMFLFYNISVGYMIATVKPESLNHYFTGYSMIMIVMFFILILNKKEIIFFTIIALMTFVSIILVGHHPLLELMGNGGFVFLTILVLMILFGSLRYMGILRDISLATEIKKAEETHQLNVTLAEANKEKETLLKEIHHRVKNNLQLVSSMLRLQGTYVNDAATTKVLKESQQRIMSMSRIHETLYKSKDFATINFSKYISDLVKEMINSYKTDPNLSINVEEELDDLYLNIDQAIPSGLIINELVTNSIKYAFEDKNEGEIYLRIQLKENQVNIKIGDNGIGIPEAYQFNHSDTLGLQIVSTLIEQLEGTIEVDTTNGTLYKIKFDIIK